ncbi:MAG: GNAT family N-acetyltransferase, partial [Candidatus Omnitrophota bacterium]
PVYFGSEGDTELISDEELRILDDSSDDSDRDGDVSRQSPTSSEDVATGKDGSIVRKSPEPRIVSFDEIASATTQLPEGQESMGDALTIKIAEVLARASEEEMCEGDIIHAQEIMAESDTIFFAVIGGEIVGFVSLKRDETNSLCIMGDLNVDAACQGQGIGSALFDQALRYAHENGLGELAFSLETDVVPFYKRNISRYRKHLRKTGRIGMFEPICRVLEFKESYDVDFTYFVKVPQGGRLPVAAARNGPAENVAYDLRAGLSRPSNSGCVVIDQGSHTKLHMNGLSKNTGTVAEQFEDILRYTQGMLAHHDAGMSNVVLGNIYLASMADRAECEAILRRHCGDASPPPVNFLEQPPMEPGHVVSFEAWAVIPHSDDVMIHRITDNTTVVEENGVYTVHIGGIVADKDFQDKFHEQMFDHEVTVVHEGGEFTTSIPQKEDPNAYYDESYVALLNLQFELDKVNKALKTNFSYEDLVRAWFYNPGFLSPDSHPSGQRYKTFCAARTDFYEPVVGKAYSGIDIRRPIKFLRRILDKNFLRKNPDFGNDGTSAGKRYPASTGIGVPMSRPLTLGAIAVSTVRGREGRVSAAPIKNAGQINPADYADEYGKKSPKFSRATFFRIAENLASLFVSGTASIIGEESVYIGDIEKQTEQTLDNIKNLISERNMRFLGLAGWGAKPRDVAFLTVYIKKPHAAHEEEARRILRENYETARRVCEREFPGIPITYVEADVCRDDLLVEIEGVAYVRYSPSLLDRVIGFLRDLAERLVKWLTGAKGRLSPEEAEDRAVSFYRAVDRLTKEILTRDSDSAVLDPIDVEREERGTFIFRDWFADVIGYVYSIGMSSGYWTVEDARNELTTVNMILDDILDRPDNRYTEPSPAVVEAAGQTFRCELLIEGAVESSRRDRRQFLPEHRVQIAEIRNRIDEILDLLDGIDGDKTLNDLIKDRIETSTNRPPVNELYPTQQRVEEAERRSRMVREIRAQFGEGANGTLGEDGSHPRQSPSSSDDADARAGKDAPAEGPHAGRGAFSGMTSDDYIKLDKAIRVIKEISTEHDQAYSRWKDNWQNEPEPELSDEEIQLLRGHVRIVESYIRDADHQKSDAAIRMIRDLLRAVALYPEYDRQMLGDTMRRVVRRQARRGEYVLDIGSGGGYQTFNALEAGAQFAVCVDIKAEALLATLARAAEIGVLDKIAVDLVDARRMSEWTPPHTFDRIISMNPVSILLDHDDPIGNWGLFDNNYFDIDGRMQDGILDAVGSLLKKDGVVNYLATFGALYGIRRRGYEIFDEEPDDRGKMISVITFRRKKDDQGRTAPRQSPTGGKDHRKRLKKKGYHRAERRYRNKKERHHKESKEYGEAVRLRKRDGTADHRRAIKILSKKVNSYGPEQKIRAINMIGDSMQRIGDYEGVIRLLEPVIAGERERAEPNDFMFTTLAKAYVASGRAPEAIVLLRPIVDGRTPIVATGYLFSTLGRAYLHLPDPDPDAAIALLRPLAERRSVIKPVRNVYHQLSEAYLLKGDRRMAAAVLESVIEGRRSDPPNDRTYGLLANVYTESGRALDAVVLLEQVMAHKTKVEPSTFIVNMLGNAYIHSGRPVDAIRLLGPVTEGKDRNIEPNVHTYNNLAKAHIANGQYWKVIAVLQTLILEEGDVLPNTLSYKFLGKAYLKMRRPNDTIRLLEPVVQLETVRGENVRPDAAMCDIIATAYLRKGWLDDAEQACLIGADLRPADIMIRYLLKKIYRVKGDKGKAGEVEREIEALEAQEVERGGSADADAIDLRGSGTDQGPDDGHFRESPSSGEALEPEEKPEQVIEQDANDPEAVKK